MHQHLLLSRSSWLDNESGRTKGDGPLRLGHKVNWLEIEGGSLAFGARQALDDVDLAVGPGVTALLGRNGAGKTTLCRVCSGDLDLDKGQVRLGGVPSPRADLAKLGWLPQSLLFPGSMRVIEAVRYAAWLKGATVEAAYDRADYWLGPWGCAFDPSLGGRCECCRSRRGPRTRPDRLHGRRGGTRWRKSWS